MKLASVTSHVLPFEAPEEHGSSRQIRWRRTACLVAGTAVALQRAPQDLAGPVNRNRGRAAGPEDPNPGFFAHYTVS